MNERIAIIDGIRTPMCKSFGVLKKTPADDLGAFVVREIMERTAIPAAEVDELIFGNVAQPANAANVARVIALKAGLPERVPAYTVHRNCGSGAESITTAAAKILTGDAEVIVAGGAESMSKIPLMFNAEMTGLFEKLGRAKALADKIRVALSFRPRFLKPVIGLKEGLTDPICGLIMGLTAEVLAKEFTITRDEQDTFALLSHQRAVAARKNGILAEEIVPIPVMPDFKHIQEEDDGPREEQSMEALAKLRPYFDRRNGTVTVGNACPITDAAAAVIVMSETRAKAAGLKPLGYLRAYAYAGLEPSRMGLGPVYAVSKLLEKSGASMAEIDLIELNEAFAVQVIANQRAFASDAFAEKYLGRTSKLGDIDPDTLNVNGGAIALGHPVGMTGTRLVLTVLKELHRRGKSTGIATMCIGGGQGGALLLDAQ